ncbi:MAG: hypothetical protein AAFZ65_07965 [Planctomycetota bacterium]
MSVWTGALLLLGAAVQDPLWVETAVVPEDQAWVGQRVSIYITVGMLSRPSESPRLDLPAVDGALLSRAPGSPLLGAERVEGVEYTTQRIEVLLFPQRAGEVLVPPIGVRARLASGDHEAASGSVRVPAVLPDGAVEGALLFTSSEVSIEQRWEPPLAEARPGDAFRRTVALRADDVLGLALPPLPALAVEGLASYPDPPTVDDRMTRGALSGSRTDSITIVCERAGRFALPDLSYRWWNPERGRFEEQVLEGGTLVVRDVEAPSASARVDPDPAPGRARGAWIGAALLLVASWVGLLLRRPVAARWAARRARRAAGEAGRFKRLRRACAADDPARSWAALTAWIEHQASTRQAVAVADWARERGAGDIESAAVELERALIDGQPWSGTDLAAAARAARRQWRRAPARRKAVLPPTLNPRAPS